MSDTPPASLRDLYSSSPSPWSFVPSLSSSDPSSSRQWSAQPPNRSRVFDLSPDNVVDESNSSLEQYSDLFKAFFITALSEYSSAALTMPWEVGKLLLQVQWLPRDAPAVHVPSANHPFHEDASDEDSQEEASETEDVFFDNPSAQWRELDRNARARKKPADEHGYIIRTVADDTTRPPYVILPGVSGGVWGMIKRVGASKTEGWRSLFKGLLTSTVIAALTTRIQPFILRLLRPLATRSHFILPLTSHVLTGLLVSPLDLLRTRLIIHPSPAPFPHTLLAHIYSTEGGLPGLYLHPHLLIPSLIDNILQNIVLQGVPVLCRRFLGVTEQTHPMTFLTAVFLGECLVMSVVLPVETVRRRLQAQSRAQSSDAMPVRACVDTNPRPYHGMVDAVWRIITEERASPRVTSARRGQDDDRRTEESEGWFQSTGIAQLYRGIGTQFSVSILAVALSVLSGVSVIESEEGWTEI